MLLDPGEHPGTKLSHSEGRLIPEPVIAEAQKPEIYRRQTTQPWWAEARPGWQPPGPSTARGGVGNDAV